MSYFSQWADLPALALESIAKRESSYDPSTGTFRNVCNFWSGACGLMQLRKIALADIKRVYGYELNALDPIHSIIGAALLFKINREYLKHYSGGQIPDFLALAAAYNGGWTVGLKYMRGQVLPSETAAYVAYMDKELWQGFETWA